MQQQLSEVGRWISAVFYGVIGNVLPYINGFVMAIKSLIQTFATFLGYELPDSSGQSNNILDSMDDSMGGISSGIDDVNSGLDGTNDKLDSAKKKAKELSGALGIDELHTFGKNTDDDSDSGKGSGSGDVGAGYIDPRILKALEDMNYLFDGVRMKAEDIKDAILGWVDNIGKIADENIFEPIRRSWDKYGGSILSNIRETKDNIIHILGGVFDVVGEKWKPFFQAASDLFFSLVDTATSISKGISKVLKSAWDNGGEYLFRKIWDLATACAKVAIKINDDFIKPVIKWFNNNLANGVGKAIGSVLKTIGQFTGLVADFVSWLSKKGNPTLKIFVGVWATLKLTNSIRDFKNLTRGVTGLDGPMKKIDALATVLSGNFGILGKGVTTLITFFQRLTNEGFSVAIQTFPKLNNLWTSSTGLINKFGDSLGSTITYLGSLASSHIPALGSVLGKLGGWLSSASFGPWVIGIGAAITGIMTLINWLSSLNVGVDEQAKKMMDDAKSYSEELAELHKQTKKDINDSNSKYALTEEYLHKLNDLTDGKNGYVKNIGEAKTYIDKINEILPNSLKISEKGYVTYKNQTDEIKKQIEQLKRKATIEAYEKEYTESLKKQKEYQEKIADATKDVSDTQKLVNEDMAKYIEKFPNASDEVAAGASRHTKKLKEQKEALRVLNNSLDKSTAMQKNLNLIIKANTGDLDRNTQSYWDSVAAQAEYISSFNGVKTSVKDISTELLGLDTTIKNSSGTEKQFAEDTKKAVLDSMAEKSKGSKKELDKMFADLRSYGVSISKEEEQQIRESVKAAKEGSENKKDINKKTLDSILKTLEDSNVKMDEETKKGYTNMLNALNEHGVKIDAKNTEIYKQMFDICKQSGIDISTEQGKQYTLMLNMLQQNGIALTKENANQYKTMFSTAQSYGIDLYGEQGKQYSQAIGLLSKYGVDMSNEQNLQHIARLIKAAADGEKEGTDFIDALKKGTGSKDIDPEVAEIMRKAGIVVDDKHLDVGFDIENPAGRIANMIDDIIDLLPDGVLKMGIKFSVSAMRTLGALGYATGGFPSVGEMFIANEKGPEYLGRMGNRNVVANNNQIITGIEGGVARGMVEALSMLGNQKSDTGNGRVVIENHIHLDVDGREIAEVIDEVKSKDGFDFGMGRK